MKPYPIAPTSLWLVKEDRSNQSPNYSPKPRQLKVGYQYITSKYKETRVPSLRLSGL